MFSLSPDQLATLASVQVSRRRSDDPLAIRRKAKRIAGFNNSIAKGLRYSRSHRMPIR